MRNISIEYSWVERTLALCDQVLEHAAMTNPANPILREFALNLHNGTLI